MSLQTGLQWDWSQYFSIDSLISLGGDITFPKLHLWTGLPRKNQKRSFSVVTPFITSAIKEISFYRVYVSVIWLHLFLIYRLNKDWKFLFYYIKNLHLFLKMGIMVPFVLWFKVQTFDIHLLSWSITFIFRVYILF